MSGAAPILLAGPTASGKSALALELAARLGGAVVNADAMQVYAEWRVLTARPSPQEEARAPHRLYGHVPVTRRYSVGAWLADATAALERLRADGLRPIVVGGTGLYFEALTRGLADIPPTPEPVRRAVAARMAAEGAAAMAQALAAVDPATAAQTDLRNPMRVARAWEALEATGRGLAAWRAETGPPAVPPAAAARLRLAAPPDQLRARIATRFDAMLAAGALAEARAVAALDLPPDLPALKAHGAPELLAHAAGAMDLAAASAQAVKNTQAYAKRQRTWMRSRMADWTALPAEDPAAALAGAMDAIDALS